LNQEQQERRQQDCEGGCEHWAGDPIRVDSDSETRTLKRVSKRQHQVRDAIEVIKQKMPAGPSYGADGLPVVAAARPALKTGALS
jgi:hypothetical protein